jgi:hypothetical protein
MNFSGQLNTRKVWVRVAVVAGLALSFVLILSFLRSSRMIASPQPLSSKRRAQRHR